MDFWQNQKNKKIYLVASEPQVILKVKRRKIETPADKIIAECDSNYIPRKVKKADALDEISVNVESLHVSNNTKLNNEQNNNVIFSRIINEEEKKGILGNPNKINVNFGDEIRVITNQFSKRRKKERGMNINLQQKNKEERIEQEYKRHKKGLNNFVKSKRRQMEIFEEKLANIEKRRADKVAKQKKDEEENKEFKKTNQIALMDCSEALDLNPNLKYKTPDNNQNLQNENSDNEEFDYYKYSGKKYPFEDEGIDMGEMLNEMEKEHPKSDDSNNENNSNNDYPDEDELYSDKEGEELEEDYHSNDEEIKKTSS